MSMGATTPRLTPGASWEQIPDERLLAATRAGDAEAFGAFFARHSRTVLTYARRRVGGAELAADLMAETFAAALIAVHDGRAKKVSDGAAWLCGIARFKIIDSYREARGQESARQRLGLQRIVPDEDDLLAIDRLAGADAPLHAALATLSEQERAAVLERVVLDLDYSEIADRTDISQTTVRKRVSRGLTRLREQMGAQTR